MGKPVSPGQALQILSVLALNTDWSQFDADELQQHFVNKPKEAGISFAVWLKNCDATMVPATATAKPPTLVLHKKVEFVESPAKNTRECLIGDRWAYKDGDINRWLPEKQPKSGAATIGIYKLQKTEGTTFREMAAAALKVGPGTSLDLLAKALKEQQYTVTLPAIEQLIKRQEAGEDVGILTDSRANFAFLEDSDGSVSVLRFRRGGGGWRGHVYRLGSGSRWDAGCCLLLRNSDALAL